MVSKFLLFTCLPTMPTDKYFHFIALVNGAAVKVGVRFSLVF